MSSQDIAKGTRGLDHIAQQLSSTDFGILVLTKSNVGAPWLNFEAGALSKSIGQSHVIPILCGIREVDIPNTPLRQFQHAKVDKSEMLGVVQSLNSGSSSPLDASRLSSAFEQWWPEFDKSYQALEAEASVAENDQSPKASPSEVTMEVMDTILAELSAVRRELSVRGRAWPEHGTPTVGSEQVNTLHNSAVEYVKTKDGLNQNVIYRSRTGNEFVEVRPRVRPPPKK